MYQKIDMYRYNVILLSLKTEGNPVIYNDMYKPGRHYVKLNKTDSE